MNAQSPRQRRSKFDLVPDAEIRRVIALLREEGVAVGAVDVRRDGVTVYPAQQTGSAYDQWKNKDADRDRPARR